MNSRIKNVISSLANNNLDGVLVTNIVDIRYLTKYYAEDAWLFISPKKNVYITDSRYKESAAKHLKNISINIFRDNIYESVREITSITNSKRIGINAKYITLRQYNLLRKMLKGSVKIIDKSDIIDKQRMQKDSLELSKIKKALEVHKSAHKYLKRIIKPGITEVEVCSRLERFVKSKNCRFSFDPIIASGPNSSLPHAKVTGRKIRNNEAVLVDMGIDFLGYKSDLTRMFFLGRIPKLLIETQRSVSNAQREAILSIMHGIRACEIDKKARNYLKKQKLAQYFMHSLGHGIGLDVHENPILSKNNNTILKEGMVITVEPGVYYPGKFGIRIEDMIVVTKKGCEILSDGIN